MPPNSNYADALSVTTFEDYSPQFWNLLIGQNKIFRFMDRLGYVERVTGGLYLTERLNYAENDTFASISAYESVPLTPQEPFTAARFSWKILAGAYSLANLVAFQNSGSKHQISNIVNDLMMVAAQSGKLELQRQIWADGTGNGSKDFGGIRHLVTIAGTGTVGGIVSGTYTWWKNQFNSTGGSFAANGYDYMLTVKHSCTRNGSDGPDLVIGDQNFIEAYEKSCLQIKRNVFENKRAADLGLPNLEFHGAACINDPNQTAGYIDLLTSQSMRLKVGMPDFKKSAMASPVDQDVKTQLFVLYGNLCTGDRSVLGNISGLTYP